MAQVSTYDDAKYSEELQMEEDIIASLSTEYSNQEDAGAGESSMIVTSRKEIGESSRSVCEICVEERERDKMVGIQNCSHLFCSDCLTKHVTVKVEERSVKGNVFIKCPGLNCSGNIGLDTCKSLIPEEVFDRWNETLVESLIDVSQKFYCPFKDCSALLVNDSGEDGVVIRESECPECHRLFCAQCYVPWHSNVGCEELQRLNSDERGNEDLMVKKLAKEKSWMRCPRCKFYVEKTQGCLHMTCRSQESLPALGISTRSPCNMAQESTYDDAEYAEELQIEEDIIASLSTEYSNQEDAGVGESSMIVTGRKEIGESSRSVCEICVEERECDKMVRIQNCSHLFCSDCLTKHVTVKVEERSIKGNVFIKCPGLNCSGKIGLDTCKSLIPEEVFDRWNEALVESLIDESQKFYCPFKDCSALLVNDSGEDGVVIRESECPECHRLFCAQCYVPWHSNVGCEELQKLNSDERGKEDLMVRKLAKEKSWMRCPSCKFYVEKTQGCLHMTCRCGSQFCYACGGMWSTTHGGCRRP